MLSSAEIIGRYYVGYYNRAPDPAGFEFWINALNNGTATLDIANFFADQVETRALYPFFADPSSSTPAAFITSIYQNLFNRDPDDAGATFWVDALTSGQVNTGQMIEAIIGGAVTNPDMAVVQNKVSAGIYWEDQANNFADFDYNQSADESASTALDPVTDDPATLAVSRAEANVFFANLTEDKVDLDDGLTRDGSAGDKIGISSDAPLNEQAAAEGSIGISSVQSASVLNLDAFRNDARFAGIDGQGVTVVVIDSGIDLNHPAFGPDRDGNGVSDRIIFARDFSEDGDGTANDVDGHGSHVASIIGSSAAGYTGVAPGVNIVAIQGLDNHGSGTSAGIEDSLRWVIDNAEALNIVAINMSLGAGENLNTTGVHPTYGDELRVLSTQLGVTTVVAAGNEYQIFQAEGASALSADPYTISIGAVGGDIASGGEIASFSQRSDDIPTLFAPGAFINAAAPGGGTAVLSGTSMAAPQVTGMIALAQQLAQQELGRFLSPAEIGILMIQTADRFVDDENVGDRVFNTGSDYGRADMFDLGEAILELAGSGGSLPPPSPGTPPANGDTIADSTSTDASITVGGTRQSAINFGGDLDYFAVSLTPGAYEISLEGAATGSGTLSDPLLALLSGSGSYLATDDDGGAGLNALIEFTVSNAGTYYISAGAYGSATGSYELGLVRTGSSGDVGESASTASSMSLGQTIANTLEFGADRDWFGIELSAGQTYVFDLVGDTLSDPVVYLYNAGGTVLAANDDGGEGLNASLEYTADRSGTHYISAEAYSNTMTGTYTLTAVPLGGAPDDFGDNTGTTGVLNPDNGFISGTLEQSGDSDWFRVELQGNTNYEFALTGTGGDGGLSDPYLYLYDASGNLIGSNDDSGEGLNALISYSTITDHTVYLAADGFGAAATGSYTLEGTVTSRSQRDVAGDTSTTATLSAGQTITGVLDAPGDADWFAVNVNAGQVYEFSLDRGGDDPINDPYLILLDSSGNLLGFDDDSGGGLNSFISYQATGNGRVYISAEAYDPATDQGTYEIGLVSNDAGLRDVPDDTSTFASISSGQTIIGTLDEPGDADWFAFEITAGQTYRIDLTRAGDTPIDDPYLRIFDQFGDLALVDDDGGNGLESRASITAITSGRIYLSAEAYDPAFDEGSYALSVSDEFSTTSLIGVSQAAPVYDYDA